MDPEMLIIIVLGVVGMMVTICLAFLASIMAAAGSMIAYVINDLKSEQKELAKKSEDTDDKNKTDTENAEELIRIDVKHESKLRREDVKDVFGLIGLTKTELISKIDEVNKRLNAFIDKFVQIK